MVFLLRIYSVCNKLTFPLLPVISIGMGSDLFVHGKIIHCHRLRRANAKIVIRIMTDPAKLQTSAYCGKLIKIFIPLPVSLLFLLQRNGGK